ncbi:5-oxoprolinase, partial [Martensiomyces pterosporus]
MSADSSDKDRQLPSSLDGEHRVRVCIDRGGTFTDCVGVFPVEPTAENPAGERTVVVKLLSEDPAHYPDAPREGIRRILELATGRPHPRDALLDTSNLESIRMGTTVATNALLERKGEPCALVITKGFRDLLKIGNQARPRIFDLSITKPDVLYQEVVEVDERVTLAGYTMDPRGMYATADLSDAVEGKSGERVKVLATPDWEKVREQLQQVYDGGIKSIAVCLLHSYTFVAHEEEIGKIARGIGFTHITLSSELVPMIKIVPRAHSATADAYLTPGIRRYVDGFASGFDSGFGSVRVDFMQSDGGLAPVDHFSGLQAILSGPAAGVVGYAVTSFSEAERVPVIGFDMGGTSTDVSRFDGRFEHVFETTTAGVTIQAPQLDINTVAAGGGSRLFFRNGLMMVGPESAGAHPGPACYRKGGPLAVTDANLLLGRLRAEHFPNIFGENEDQPLDLDATRTLFAELAGRINDGIRAERRSLGQSYEDKSVEEIALGFLQVANETMCRPIRALTEAKGHDVQRHVLACFGGAGGQHACAVAENLGIRRVFVHRLASVLSAYGLGLAEVVNEEQAPAADTWTAQTQPALLSRLAGLADTCQGKLTEQGFTDKQIRVDRFLNMRYDGTDTSLMVPEPEDGDFTARFESMHQREFGFVLHGRAIIVDDLRVRSMGSLTDVKYGEVYDELRGLGLVPASKSAEHPAFVEEVPVYFQGGFRDTAIFRLEKLVPGEVVRGPAIVLDRNSTVLVEPGWTAAVTSTQLVLEHSNSDSGSQADSSTSRAHASTDLDPIQLSVFAHRFMSIAEQMGRTLEKTSVSTNIKERLDFSCALFDQLGNLVANAPHIPVHLGSMSHAVQFQIQRFSGDLHEGDVIMANHPQAGGSHLPDITVITPVFKDGRVIFFVASRGHHADIGGISPGSMPPTSKELFQEGASIMGMKIVKQGEFQEGEVIRVLLEEPAKHPGCSGTRNLKDVMSDLKAQIAANHRGIALVHQLCAEYGLDVVQAYMAHIQRTAELAVRSLLRSTRKQRGTGRLAGSDFMDDGSQIVLSVEIEEDGSALFDFTGTTPEVYANTNAPPSVTYSAIIYCLRCMVQSELPLNQGCLAPVKVIIPEYSLLSPSATAAVVGGNVLTSQRLCDTILSAFGAAAASQGCMNNLTFGMPVVEEGGRRLEGWGYYETIAGGHGAGPTWDGQSGVHTHMTNTRITDPEILERRYPVILHQFSLRENTGGKGLHTGGDGCVRDIEFLEAMSVSLLTERRVFSPPGLGGGENGARGINLWKRAVRDGEREFQVLNMGGKNTVFVSPGDHIVVLSPGGGGYG